MPSPFPYHCGQFDFPIQHLRICLHFYRLAGANQGRCGRFEKKENMIAGFFIEIHFHLSKVIMIVSARA